MEPKQSIKHWYVAYTFPKAEKNIYKNLCRMQITSYLPLQEVVRSWSDRKKIVSIPLFPNYIFIYSSHTERYDALDVKGIIRYVSFNGKPAILQDSQIDSLKKILNRDITMDEPGIFQPGCRVKIIDGPFIGAEGSLEKVSGKLRLLVRIDFFDSSVSVDLSRNLVAPC